MVSDDVAPVDAPAQSFEVIFTKFHEGVDIQDFELLPASRYILKTISYCSLGAKFLIAVGLSLANRKNGTAS